MKSLRNEDFRKLLDTPADPNRFGGAVKAQQPTPNAEQKKAKPKKYYRPHAKPKPKEEPAPGDEDDAHLKEILGKYRDRAAERRRNEDAGGIEEDTGYGYHAVPSDKRDAREQARERYRTIQESKYLGGDLEHTHLVKGLDYSLLKKARCEMATREAAAVEDPPALEEAPVVEEKSKNRMVLALNQLLFEDTTPKTNPYFAKQLLTYMVEIDADNDALPTPVFKSVTEARVMNMNRNAEADMTLIEKMSQLLNYARAAAVEKPKKRQSNVPSLSDEQLATKNEDIFEGVGEYKPIVVPVDQEKRRKSSSKPREAEDVRRSKRRDEERDRGDRRRGEREHDRDRRRERDDRRDRDRDDRHTRKEEERRRTEREAERLEAVAAEQKQRMAERIAKRRKEAETGSLAEYAECYPGGMAELGMSDDDAGTALITSSKKPKNTSVFEVVGQDADYANSRGDKENGQKKPNRAKEDRRLDRELDKINQIIEKRKGGAEEVGFKRPRY